MSVSRIASLAWVAGLLVTACTTGSGGGPMDGGAQPDGSPPDANPPAQKCNGHEALCDRRYDQIAHPMTHNAMSNAAGNWVAPNQNFGITRQLEDGVRGLMLDTYEEEGQLLLCHSVCFFGSQPLVEGLEEIEAFLAQEAEEGLESAGVIELLQDRAHLAVDARDLVEPQVRRASAVTEVEVHANALLRDPTHPARGEVVRVQEWPQAQVLPDH